MLVGKTVAHVWFGDYSALYLELGELSADRVRRIGYIGNHRGEITVYAGYGWSADGPAANINGRGSSDTQREYLVHCLLAASIASARLGSNGAELEIKLTNETRLVTLSEDILEPEWSVSFNAQKLGHLCIKQGLLHVDRRNS